jgi:hypothetical protein
MPIARSQSTLIVSINTEILLLSPRLIGLKLILKEVFGDISLVEAE